MVERIVEWCARNRFLVFTATGYSVTVTSECPYDVDLYGYHRGVDLDSTWSTSGYEMIHFATTPGETYVVLLNGWGDLNGTYTATVNVSSP